jgi:UDP-GlcNAc:undecaprenyl-phosphate GlcNAc-1-phosphate transferase
MLAGVVMALLGVRPLYLPVMGLTVPPSSVLVVLTVVVVVLAANAVNFVDGLDGLAAGMVAISASAFFAYSYLVSRDASPNDYSSTATVIAAVTVGACLGFLPHNLHPARVFMGDSGALTLGLLLAAATISITGDTDPGAIEQIGGLGPAFVPLLLPVAALLVPVADVVLAVVRRTLAGRSPFSPDRQHLHHRMLALGHSHRWAVALLHAWAALIAFSAAATAYWPWGDVVRVAGVLGAVLAFLTVLPIPFQIRRARRRRRSDESSTPSAAPSPVPSAADTGVLS